MNTSKIRIIQVLAMLVLLAVVISLSFVEQKRIDDIKSRCTETVGGTCVSCVYEKRSTRRGKNRSYYHLVVSYKINGMTYMAEGRSERPYEQGDSLGVQYDPEDPSVSYTGTAPLKSDSYLPILGVVFAIPIAASVVLTRKRA